MKDSFEEVMRNYLIDEQRVLEEVDEYSAYCYYLSFNPTLRKAYNSPFRKDYKPSFSLYPARKGANIEYFWKDSGIGKSGNIFTLVGLLYGLKGDDILRKIDEDFDVGLYSTKSNLVLKPPFVPAPPDKQPSSIRVRYKAWTEEGRAYWRDYIDNLTLLNTYYVQEVQVFWVREDQDIPIRPKGLTFSYRIDEIDESSGEITPHYKIYQPYNDTYKFINDYTDQMVEGYQQLPEVSDLLIITKATKDVIVLRDLGYNAIAPRGESVMIPTHILLELAKRFTRIIILFDNDGKHKGSSYPYKKIEIPLTSNTKDVSDYRKMYGRESTEILLKELLK